MAGVEGRVALVTGSVAGTKTVLEAQAPAFSVQEAEAIARQAFDIQASAHPLASERDQNFQLCAKDGSEWVLKIANPAENSALLAIIPVLLGAIVMVHAPRWNFVPAEGFPMGGMEFQVVLALIATYFLIVGNAQPGNAE